MLAMKPLLHKIGDPCSAEHTTLQISCNKAIERDGASGLQKHSFTSLEDLFHHPPEGTHEQNDHEEKDGPHERHC